MRRRRPSLGLIIALLAVGTAALLARELPHLRRSAPAEPVVAQDREAAPGASQATTGAWYELAFTDPRYPEIRAAQYGGVDERLVALMDRAQRTLDAAIYDLDLDTVAEALARAAGRGVRVRVVTDSDTVNNAGHRFIQQAFAKLRSAGIPVVDDNRRAIMHHKFTVVDREWVQTGSWNYTHSDTFRANNHFIVIQSRPLAESYTAEFERMFTERRFGPGKRPGTAQLAVDIAGARVESYFAPQDSVAAQVIRWIGSARQRIHFMAFSFTHDGIGDAMLERARAGIQVAGVFETTGSETEFSEYGRLKRAGLDVLLDGNPWAMHHKVILIDRRVAIFGSYNYSSNADNQNDENLLIVEDPGLVAAFEAEYQRVRATALNPMVRR